MRQAGEEMGNFGLSEASGRHEIMCNRLESGRQNGGVPFEILKKVTHSLVFLCRN